MSSHRFEEATSQMIINQSDFEKPEILHHENYSSDVSSNILAIDKITSESNWSPLIGVEEGIKQSINNWVSDENSLT